MLLAFGFISFGVAFALIWLVALVCMLRAQWYYARHRFGLWKKSLFSSSLSNRLSASKDLMGYQEPSQRKWWKFMDKFGKSVLLIWLTIFITVAVVVIVRDIITK
jgi:hypothetical protein